MEAVEITIDALAPTMQEFDMPDKSNVYVSIPDYEEEEEVIFEEAFEEEEIPEKAAEVFELNMEEEAVPSFTTEFVLNKPINIYAETELEEEVISKPTNNAFVEAAFNDIVIEAVEPTAPENVESIETSFRSVELEIEEEPTMQLVMREESSVTPQNRPQHSSFDISLDNSEEQRRKVAERIQKLRNLSFNINNGADPGVEFDAVPAYVRRNLDLFGNTMASVENYYSKYTVEQDENNQTQISTINSFLDGKKPD
jgi:cell division protein FtsZ